MPPKKQTAGSEMAKNLIEKHTSQTKATPANVAVRIPFSPLVPGQVSKEHLDKLLSFMKISDNPLYAALHAFFVDGSPQKDVVGAFDIKQSFLSRRTKDVQNMHKKLFEILEFYPVTEVSEAHTKEQLKDELREELLERVRDCLR